MGLGHGEVRANSTYSVHGSENRHLSGRPGLTRPIVLFVPCQNSGTALWSVNDAQILRCKSSRC